MTTRMIAAAIGLAITASASAYTVPDGYFAVAPHNFNAIEVIFFSLGRGQCPDVRYRDWKDGIEDAPTTIGIMPTCWVAKGTDVTICRINPITDKLGDVCVTIPQREFTATESLPRAARF